MNDQKQPHPWCIVRLLPNLQRLIVGRCHRRNDAEAHLQFLRQQISSGDFTIIFDPSPYSDDVCTTTSHETLTSFQKAGVTVCRAELNSGDCSV